MQEARVTRLGNDLASMPDDMPLSDRQMRALTDAGLEQMREDPDDVTTGTYVAVPSSQAWDRLELKDMPRDRVDEAARMGHWDPDSDDWVAWTPDGDLKGMDRDQAARLLWRGRGRFIHPDTTSRSTYRQVRQAFDMVETSRNVKELADWAGRDAKDMRRVVFDRLPDGRSVTGWALEDRQLSRDRIPEGWHVYTVTAWDSDEPDEDLMRAKGIDPATAPEEDVEYKQVLLIDSDINANSWSAHRFDFATRTDLDQAMGRQPIEIPDDDTWAFTEDTLDDETR